MESFFGSLKEACIASGIYSPHEQVSRALFEHMEIYYCPVPDTIDWQDTTHLLLADTGGPRGRPHIYHLQLEGKWYGAEEGKDAKS